MRNSEIKFNIELDDQNLPEKIFWKATDAPSTGPEEAKAISLSIWDHQAKETLRIDLWGKDMPIDEMKRFYIDTVAGLSQSLRNSTGDAYMADEMDSLCERLVDYLKKINQI